MKEIFEAIIMGIVQGLTEFLPVSSSGHLVIFSTIFGFDPAGSEQFVFNIALHLGTLFSVLFAFRAKIYELLCGFFALFVPQIKKRRGAEELRASRKTIVMLIIATLPLFAVLFFKDKIEELFQNPFLVGLALLATALLLFYANAGRGGEPMGSLTPKKSLIVGLFQCAAVIPGLSRSGTTMAGGIFAGLKKDNALSFSFLLSIPAVLGACVLEAVDIVKTGFPPELIGVFIAGMVSSAVVGFLAISLLKLVVSKNKLSWFAVYCSVMGLFAVIASFFIR